MIKETIYVAINHKDEIQWVRGSSRKTRYFKTDRYLKGAVEYHNKYHPDDIWKVRKCVILEDEPTTQTETQNSNLSFEKADEPQTEQVRCGHYTCHNYEACKKNGWQGCVYEPQTEAKRDDEEIEHYGADPAYW